MKLAELAFGLQYLFLSKAQKAAIHNHLKREQDIMRVISVLPGQYRSEQVRDALRASGVHPETLYMSLAAGETTVALATFYEALRGLGDASQTK